MIFHPLPSMPPRGAPRSVIGETLGPETAPVIGCDLVQRIHDVIEGVGFHRGPGAGRTMESWQKSSIDFLPWSAGE